MEPSDVRIRVGTADDWQRAFDLVRYVFHETPTAEGDALERATFEPDRSLVAEDDDLVVGHALAYTRDLTVPGAIVPAAHVSQVAVAPTHRRRGLLTRMMHRQLHDVAEAGREPIAVLWASESGIYSRYGYGPAAQRLTFTIMNREAGPPDAPAPTPGGRLRLVRPADAVAELAGVYERLRPARTGWSSRDDRWWRIRLSDPEANRGGATALRGVVHDTPHGPTGYAVWRTRGEWDAYGPKGAVHVVEAAAADPGTYAALWRFLLTADLTRTTEYHFGAVDEPLQYLVDEPRRLGTGLKDALWVRVVDVPAALAARRYATAVDVVLDVTDPLLPANTGRFRLTGGPDGATCAPTGDAADLSCTVLELGTAYLGGVTLAALAAAGRVRELTPGTLGAATAAFGADRMPNPVEMF